ncbi:MAG TPA: EAL domain-containing protein [Gaiellaceae bacterium]|nr:EAL domain-containing protein [Gaiellaceae bacterium]
MNRLKLTEVNADPVVVRQALQMLKARARERAPRRMRRRHFRGLVDGVDAIVWEADPATFRITFVSRSVEILLGHPRAHWYAQPLFWQEHIAPEHRERVLETARAHLAAGEGYELEYPMVAADGHVVWLRDLVRVFCNAHGAPVRVLGVSIDISERKEVERSLLESRSRTQAILDAALDCVITIDHEGRIVEFNRAAERTFGYTRADVLGEEMAELIVPPGLRDAHRRGFDRYLATGEGDILGTRLELTAMRADGSEFPVEIAIVRAELPGPPVFTAYLRDITDRRHAEELQRRSEEELKRQALHDSLTGLPNRALFRDRVEHGIHAARREGRHLAVAILDLDRFKEINDALGHQSGDRVLQKLGRRLLAALRASDTVARLGGDEFGVVLTVGSLREATEAIGRVQEVFAKPFTLGGVPLHVEASVGLALYPTHGTDGDQLLQRADVAMYVAKASDRDLAVYDPSEDRSDPSRLALGAELRQALDGRELLVHYQPQVDMRTGAASGVEALIRWRHPARGLLHPEAFIPFAEHTGLIRPLTLYVLDEALRQCRVWLRDDPALKIAVNVAMPNLLDIDFPAAVEALLERQRFPAPQLVLEITESAIAADPFRARRVIDGLSALGVRLSIDDYGTGYSSLGHLRRLPVHELKIDRSFVMSMATNADDATIVRTTIDLGQNLGLRVVAEGIETTETYERLRALGCDTGQGFLLSRPVPAEELTTWLARARKTRPAATGSAFDGRRRSAAAGISGGWEGSIPKLADGT